MKEYIVILILAYGMLYPSAQAQEISSDVSPASGDHFQAGGYQIFWTVGDLSADADTGGTTILTAGFQQGEIPFMVSNTSEEILAGIHLSTNPVTDFIHLQRSQHNFPLQVKFFTTAGKQLQKMLWRENQSLKIPVSKYPAGNYLLQLSDPKSGYHKSIRILITKN